MYTIVKRKDWEDFAKELEAKSDVRWGQHRGIKPTYYNPFLDMLEKEVNGVPIVFNGYEYLSIGVTLGVEYSNEEFIKKCAEIKPLSGNESEEEKLKKELALLKIIKNKYEIRESIRQLQILTLKQLDEARVLLLDANEHFGSFRYYGGTHCTSSDFTPAVLDAIENIEVAKKACYAEIENTKNMIEEEQAFNDHVFGDGD